MSAPAQVHDALSGDAALVALVASRIYPRRLPPSDPDNPDGRFPCVVFYAAGLGPGPETHDGPSGWERPRFSFDCWATTYAGAWQIADAVRAALRAACWTPVSVVDMSEVQANPHRVVVDATLWTTLT